jgi:hypothetical protein
MIWDYASAISGIVATIICIALAVYSFSTFRIAAIRCRQREARLPEATRFEDLRQQIDRHHEELEELRVEIRNAQAIIGQSQVSRAEYNWLQERSDLARGDLNGLRQLYAERKYDAEIDLREGTAKLRSDFDKLTDELRQQQRTLELSFENAKLTVGRDIGETEREWEQRKKAIEIDGQSKIQALEQSLASSKAILENEIEHLEREQAIQKSDLELQHQSVMTDLLRDFESRKLKISSSFETQKAEFIAQLELLKSQTAHSERETNRLEIERLVLTQDVEEMSESRSELKIAVDALRSEKQSIEKALPQLQDLWRRLLEQTGGGTDSDRTAELWQPVFSDAELENNFSEEEGLQHVKKYLQSCGLQYSSRTLFAFHTSLKVSDSSPLVVLAGISGTGKSELPRRYAEAMGINFLPMAVQPRWDSPQDMFGFFNYLENRFRATALGRSLVQMDPYYSESGRGWPAKLPESYVNLSNQMLMVLLDEMNLARVEYYFSEFLSRLEFRREIREQDPDDRRKAELAFEIGRSGFGSPTMNIFVARNVMFVGTMNEDETTQTLSDKVVDRANVIRFGCPKSLELIKRPEQLVPTTYRLDVKTWDGWRNLQDEPQDHRSQLEEWIDRLKQAMSQVKRPFAHRTSRSIRSYVASYPRIDSNWFRHAVADQIEQKLLPKFRGLDPSEAEVRQSLDKIRDIAKELEDTELVDAIQISRNGHQFSWTGIDRATLTEAEA